MLSSFMLFFLPLTFSCTHLRTVRTGSYAPDLIYYIVEIP